MYKIFIQHFCKLEYLAVQYKKCDNCFICDVVEHVL